MRKVSTLVVIAFFSLTLFTGCGGGASDVGSGGSTGDPDLAVVTIIDDITGFVNMIDGATDTNVTNANGVEVDASSGLFAYNGYLYTTGSRGNDKIAKYAVNTDNSLTKVAEINVYESGGSIPTCIIFVDDTKAYLMLAGVGELLVFNPFDLSITKRIDLSAYAMDADGEFGGDDHNPEPSGGVIRDGKLFLALAQFDAFTTWQCRGKASLLIIDVATDEILKHISDDRTCNSGVTSPNNGLILDEKGDIYVVNTASFGYYPGMNAGILRIKNGEDEFDPDYYFSITNLTDLDVPGGVASYAYNNAYLSNGEMYTTLLVPGLTSNPPDYINDKNYVPYMFDLWNQTVTKLAMPSTNGWGSHMIKYNDDIIFGMATVNGTGLYYAGDDMPFVTLEGNPYMLANYE
jgi:hypothetical protein